MRRWIESNVHFLALMVAIVGAGATLLTVPEVRWRLLHDLKAKPEYLQRPVTDPPTGASPRPGTAPDVPAKLPADPPQVVPPAVSNTAMWTEVRPRTVFASSVLPTSRVTSYGPEMVFDGRQATVWVEGADGDGSGEWVAAELPYAAIIEKIGIVNGYGRESRYLENERVRDALVTFSDGTQHEIHLADSNEIQYFALPPTRTTTLRLTILSVYPGTRWTDAAVGEIRFWTRQ